MKKSLFTTVLFIIISSTVFGQEEDAWVYFKDKPSSASFLSSPLTMLTQRALDRRTNQSISLDIKDVPVEASYVNAISNTAGITIKARSKWLNALHIRGTKIDIDLLKNLVIVDSIDFADKTLNKSRIKNKRNDNDKFGEVLESDVIDYGLASNQIEMLDGDFLHDLGYTGLNVHIAVLDAGFKGVETFSAFSNLHDSNNLNGEILGGYDFVNRNSDFYLNTGSTHGLSVLSTMAGFIENQFVGTAPDAQYYLFVTEDAPNETPLEESLWVEAAERADSLGVDIINTSLGYTTFDDSAYDYSYTDMNGETAFISKGAEIATSRGMMIVASAGNSGSASWHYIGAPGDAKSVLTVGSVDSIENSSNFSSYGPTSDNRVKPEVLAQGGSTYVINSSGNIATSNGTSFSSPVMAGMVACLWQVYPNKTVSEIKDLIVQSSDIYANPTAQRGYGVPNFQDIYNTLSLEKNSFQAISIYPTIVENIFRINFNGNVVQFKGCIKDLSGRLVKKIENIKGIDEVDVSTLRPGLYFLELEFNHKKCTLKLIKK
jgi:hypothetical protein